MIVSVVVDGAGPQVRLDDPDNFTQFEVQVPEDLDVRALGDGLDQLGLGWISGADVFIRIASIRPMVPDATDAWDAGFAKMIQYAATKDWISPDGSAVQAHIVRLPTS